MGSKTPLNALYYQALALTLGALAPNAWAAESWEQTSVIVHYGDLNLSSRQGAETLHRRIKAAAEEACGEGYQPGDLARASVYHRCVNAASERALQKVQVALSQVQWVVK